MIMKVKTKQVKAKRAKKMSKFRSMVFLSKISLCVVFNLRKKQLSNSKNIYFKTIFFLILLII